MTDLPKIITRELRLEGEAFSVYRYTVQLGQKRILRDIIERKHGVVIVPFDANGRVLLIEEYCAGSNSFVLSLPGGSIENEEDIQAEAQRELREETGFTAEHLVKLHFAYTHPCTSNRRSHAFMAYGLKRDPVPGTEEIIRVVPVPLDEAIARTKDDFVSDVSTIANLLLARDKMQELGLLKSSETR